MIRTHSMVILATIASTIILLAFMVFGSVLHSAQEKKPLPEKEHASATGSSIADESALQPAAPTGQATPFFRQGGQAAMPIITTPSPGNAPATANAGRAPAAPIMAPSITAPSVAGNAAGGTSAGTVGTGAVGTGSFSGVIPLVTPVPAGGGGGVPVSRG